MFVRLYCVSDFPPLAKWTTVAQSNWRFKILKNNAFDWPVSLIVELLQLKNAIPLSLIAALCWTQTLTSQKTSLQILILK